MSSAPSGGCGRAGYVNPAGANLSGGRGALLAAALQAGLFAQGGVIGGAIVHELEAVGAMIASGLLICASVWFAPIAALLVDDLSRRPLRWLSRAIALAAATIPWVVFSLLGAFFLVLGAEAPFSEDLREDVAYAALDFWDEVSGVFVDSDVLGRFGYGLVLVLAILLYVVLPVWLVRRTWQVEHALASPTPRPICMTG